MNEDNLNILKHESSGIVYNKIVKFILERLQTWN